MTVPLNREIKTLTENFIVSPADREILKRCISRYSTPRSFSQALFYIAYRVLNAAKSIFKKSDWQLAEKVLIRRVKTHEKMEKILRSYPTKHDQVNELVKSTIEKGKISIAEIILPGMIRINEGKTTKKQIESKIKDNMEQWGKNFQEKLNKLVNQLPPEYRPLKEIQLQHSWWTTSS